MFAFRPVFIPLLYLVIGVIVAAVYDYFNNLETAGQILTLITAVIMWPFLLFGFEINIQRNAD
jgi:ABC-type Na+ efflux pump permease subunit